MSSVEVVDWKRLGGIRKWGGGVEAPRMGKVRACEKGAPLPYTGC